jgi:hypothetical protein
MNKYENLGNSAESEKRFMDFQGEQFEVNDVDVLQAKDIKSGDRIMIKTQDGNRYMIRWSKSANAPKIYNEKADGFKTGYELGFTYSEGDAVAEVGKVFKFAVVANKEKTRGKPFAVAEVVAIEIRREIDDAIEKAASTSLAGMLINQVSGKKKRID